MSFLADLKKEVNKHIRDLGMLIALVVIFVYFGFATKGNFISVYNLSNLITQTGFIAVIAAGMTLVIVIRHIDLSVGFLSGFMGAVAAHALEFWHLPVIVVIPMILIFGAIAGLLTAFPVAKLGIPAFVASLAGWLIYRGALMLATMKTGTIIINNDTFNAIGGAAMPDLLGWLNILPHNHKLTLLIGALAVVFIILGAVKSRRKKVEYGFEVPPKSIFIMTNFFIGAVIALVAWILSQKNQGMTWTLLIVIIVTIIYHFVTTKTVLGRHIFAVGGNPEAAELSGINVEKITFIVFSSNGLLAALSGMLYAARLHSATPTAGTMLELDVIAASFIGGVSAAGGVGSVIGSLIGAFVYTSLTNGMLQMQVDVSIQYIIRGAVLVAAVIFDVATRKSGQAK
ncbi:MAG: sugar ABC transporter permease [Spirochaetaceae bacterium]|jgi:putative multiple sugar transport system permease protein|nr:sugar ABC transporter permease [Spirochaetaceae bacterium]